MTDQPAARRPDRQPKKPRQDGSWIPLLGSAAILAVMLGLILTAALAK